MVPAETFHPQRIIVSKDSLYVYLFEFVQLIIRHQFNHSKIDSIVVFCYDKDVFKLTEY